MDLEKETTSERSSRCREELTALLMTEPLSVAQIRERIQVGSEVKSAFFTNLLYNMKAAGQINLHVSGRYWVDGFPPDAWDNPDWKRKVAVNTRPPAKRKDAPTVTRSNPTNPKAGPFIAQPTIPPGVNADIAPATTQPELHENVLEDDPIKAPWSDTGAAALSEAIPPDVSRLYAIIDKVKKAGNHEAGCMWWAWDFKYSWSESDCTCEKARPSELVSAKRIETLYLKVCNLKDAGHHNAGCLWQTWDFTEPWDPAACTCMEVGKTEGVTIIEDTPEPESADNSDSYLHVIIELEISPGDIKRMGNARLQQIMQAATVLLTAKHQTSLEQMAEQSR